MNDKNLRAWFVVFVVAVFMAGVGGGLLLDRFVRPPGPRGMPRGRADMPMAGLRGPGRGPGLANALANDLRLTPDQKTKLDAILAERQKRIQQVQDDVRNKFQSEQRDLRAEIEKILTPEQRKRFDEWVPAEGMIWRGRGPGRGRGMGPGMGPGGGMGRGPQN